MEFSLQKSELNGIPVIQLIGTLMDSEVYRFSREIKDLAKKGSPTIIVDVTKCDFMDSHALGLLVFHHTSLQKENRKLVFLNENADAGSYMTVLLETTGLIQLLAVATSRQDIR